MATGFDLDAACGRHFRYRDLIECGKTWSASVASGTPIDNAPRVAETLEALSLLCTAVLDPIAEALGRPQLTYGFASPNLTRRIPSRIAPRLDQHAACERDRSGAPVCKRLGAAADVIVPGVSATTLARWIFANAEFDRIYMYGDDRPLHVSVGPERSRAVIELLQGSSNRRTPRMLRW